MEITPRENIIVGYRFEDLLNCFKYILVYVEENGVRFNFLFLEEYEVLLDKCIYDFIVEGLNLIADGVNEYILDMHLDCKIHKIIKNDGNIIIEQLFLIKYFLKLIYFGQNEDLKDFLNEIK